MGSNDFLKQFSQIWEGGYYEGNPLDPMSTSSYGPAGYNSVLYTTYLACIRPYVSQNTVAIEIGPGRGAWTRAILARDPKRVYVLDAAPPEHSHFWHYVGADARVSYITVTDFTMDGVPDQCADYFFSFGVFCHLKPEHCYQYISSLFGKLTPRANGFLMIADFDKFNGLVSRLLRSPFPHKPTWASDLVDKSKPTNLADPEGRGGWYHLGIRDACRSLVENGFEVVEEDIGVNFRDPVIHFRKP